MLECEGFKMLFGVCRITPKCEAIAPFNERGTWLYRPDSCCWYCNGKSYSAEIVTVVEDCT